MRLVVRFMKPYWALCAVTTVLLLVDVVGARWSFPHSPRSC
ncbi:MAG: hypothetical protein ACLVEF_08085 [Bifidobacterium bifidum]